MIIFYIIALVALIPITIYLLARDSQHKAFVFSFAFILIGISLLGFTSKFSFLGSAQEVILVNELQEAMDGNTELNADFFIKFDNLIEDNRKNSWLEQAILYAIDIESLVAAEQLMKFAEPIFANSNEQVRFYAIYSILRDKKFPEYALAKMEIDFVPAKSCRVERVNFNLFIANGPAVPIAKSISEDPNVFKVTLSNTDSMIPGFDIASALINEEKVILKTGLLCTDSSTYYSNFSSIINNMNAAILKVQINEKDWSADLQ